MKLQGDIARHLDAYDAYAAFRRSPWVRPLPGAARRALFALVGVVRQLAGHTEEEEGE